MFQAIRKGLEFMPHAIREGLEPLPHAIREGLELLPHAIRRPILLGRCLLYARGAHIALGTVLGIVPPAVDLL